MVGLEAEWTLHERPSLAMSCAVPVRGLLIFAVFVFPTSAVTSKISSRFPHQILLNTSLQVLSPPLRVDILSVRWEHNGRPLLEYKGGNLTLYSPRAMMTLEQVKLGNVSLVLTNLTFNYAGNYTCVIQYGGVLRTAIYALIIEPTRIRLLNLTPPPQKAGVTLVRSSKKSLSLNVNGEAEVTARLGENATLPCHFKMNDITELSMLVIHWSKDGVTKYFANKTCCEFPGHEIMEEDLQNGRAPLQLVNVQEKDAGKYTCAIKYEATEESWSTTFLIQGLQDNFSSQVQDLTSQAETTAITPETDEPAVPESMLQYRAVKYGLVSGVVVVIWILAAFLYFCFAA